MTSTHLRLIAASLILGLSPSLALAQSNACSADIPIAMHLESDFASTVPSASIGIYAVMENGSADIISNASLAVDVVKKDTGAIVDRFVWPKTVTIFGASSAKAGFIWKVPGALESGVYTVNVTFAPDGAMRAAVYAHALYPHASLDITIKDGAPAGEHIRTLSVNGQPYTAWSVAPFSQGRLAATADTDNQSAAPYRGTLVWRTYAPGATLTDAPVNESTSILELHPGTSGVAAYDLPQGGDAYYVEGQLKGVQRNVYFDILLDRGGAAFPWAGCMPAAQSAASPRAIATMAIVGAILVAGVAWELYERRRRRS